MDIWNTILTALLVATTLISTIFAIYYKRKEYKVITNRTIRISSLITIYETREAMLKGLHQMYDIAQPNDIIWGQSVSGRNYGSVVDKISLAASRNVRFKFLFNKNASVINQIKDVFCTISTAQIKESEGNIVRIQGLSEKQVIIAISDYSSYIGLQISDPTIVCIFKEWFDKRFLEV